MQNNLHLKIMFRLNLYLGSCFLLLCSTSCPDEPPCIEEEYVAVYVSLGQKTVAYPIKTIYGIGANNQTAIKPIENGSTLDTGYLLPLNVHTDYCRFVFQRINGLSDTIGLNYKLSFNVDEERCGFQFDLEDIKLQYLSAGLDKDSSELSLNYGWPVIFLRLK